MLTSNGPTGIATATSRVRTNSTLALTRLLAASLSLPLLLPTGLLAAGLALSLLLATLLLRAALSLSLLLATLLLTALLLASRRAWQRPICELGAASAEWTTWRNAPDGAGRAVLNGATLLLPRGLLL